MPNTKSSDIRYKILDRCLRRGGYSMANLRDAVNEELVFQGLSPVTALNTTRGDIRFIETTYPDIIVKETRSGRNKTYAYENPDSSIFKLQFNDDELSQLSQCMAILSQFEGMPQMDWLQSFMDRFKLSLNIESDGKQIVGFDYNPYLKGRQHFASLLTAISEKRVLSLEYKNFKQEKVDTIIVHPYFLEEYNNRWFLLGFNEDKHKISNFAFDRIISINTVSFPKYRKNEEIDFNQEYFDNIIGVSHTNAEQQPIIIKVAKDTYPYIETKALHWSQSVVDRDEDSVTIKIKVAPNFELEQCLLSYGEAITVVQPISLREKIKERINRMRNNYELAQND